MNIHIREAELGDAASIVRLIAELAETGGDHSPLTGGYVADFLTFPGSHVLLAEEEGQVVGLLSYSIRPNLYHAGNVCLIDELVVHGAVRGRGVGGALVSALLERLVASGCAEVSVSTLPDNQGAIQFYKRHGFVDEAVFLEKHFGE